MRYFLISNGGTVLDKHAYAGDNEKIDALIAQYQASHPTHTVQEVEQTAFNSSVVVSDPAPTRADAITKFAGVSNSDTVLTRAILLVILDEINVLRGLLSQAPRTVNQMKNAINNKINAGSAD